MSEQVSPQEFGELLQAVRQLTKSVDELTKKVDELEGHQSALINRGKGFLAGACLLAGGSITAAYEFLGG